MRSNVYIKKYKTKSTGEARYLLIVREYGRRDEYIQLGPVSKKVAEERRILILHQLLNGEYMSQPEVSIYFSEFLDRNFFPWVQGVRAPRSVAVYEEHLKPLRERFKGYRLVQIQRQDIERHLSNWEVGGRTKNIRLSVLRLVFTKALEWKYLAKSPMEGIKRFPESSQGSRALTPNELTQLYEGLTTWQKSLIRVMVNSGVRPGEVANLKFQDIDWDQNRLTVANDKTRQTKNRKTRFIPMNEDLREELIFLKDYLPLQGRFGPDKKDFVPRQTHQRDYVFCFEDGTKVACIRQAITRAMEKHGIQGVTPHGLRKTFCSLLARAKIHPKVAQTLMGHSDITLTMRVYTEIDDGQLVEAVNALPTMHELKRAKLRLVNGQES